MNIATATPPSINDDEIRALGRQAQPAKSVTGAQREILFKKIKELLKEKDAVLVAHYYTDADLQLLAEETGGLVSDSLDTLMVAGVRFMGETAKILTPEKRILMPTLEAECSLDLSCPIDEFSAFCDAHPDRTVVVYANTSAAVKARADWVVTSSIATKVIQHLSEKGEKILWGPDRFLGSYIQKETGADMLLWQGSCIVHDEFKAVELNKLREQHPSAAVLVHPESPEEIIAQADIVGSTTQLIDASTKMKNDTFIVATDNGIFYKMKQASPNKKFIEAPTGGVGATCMSCAHCTWMAMNGLENLALSLENSKNEIFVDETIRQQALKSVTQMMDFAEKLNNNN